MAVVGPVACSASQRWIEVSWAWRRGHTRPSLATANGCQVGPSRSIVRSTPTSASPPLTSQSASAPASSAGSGWYWSRDSGGAALAAQCRAQRWTTPMWVVSLRRSQSGQPLIGASSGPPRTAAAKRSTSAVRCSRYQSRSPPTSVFTDPDGSLNVVSPLEALASQSGHATGASRPIITVTDAALAKVLELRDEEADAEQLGLRLAIASG